MRTGATSSATFPPLSPKLEGGVHIGARGVGLGQRIACFRRRGEGGRLQAGMGEGQKLVEGGRSSVNSAGKK